MPQALDETGLRAPHLPRCLARLEEIEAPVVQLWGWPGSGCGALLEALLERPDARPLAPADLPTRRSPAALDRWRKRVADARWLVASSPPRGVLPEERSEWLAALAEALPAGGRLVIATRRRIAARELLYGLLGPRELALRAAEVTALLAATGAAVPGPEAAARLAEASDGWYRPLALASRAAGPGGRVPADARALAALPPVAELLRFQVLADLPEAEREVLRAAAAGDEGGPEAVVRSLVEEWGLLLETREGLRPPRLLAALLEAERRAGAGALSARRPGSHPTPATAPLPGEPPASARIRLHLLGRPEAWLRESDGSWRRLHWPLRRALEVLAYLASSPERRAAKEELEAELWSVASEAVVKRNFHPTLSHLRRGLRDAGAAPPLQLAEGVYALNPEIGWWIDVEELERLSAEGRSLADQSRDEEAAAAWEAAWRLYRGPFLAGSSEPWAVARREEHQRPYLAALRELGSAYERLGRPTEALDAYRALLVEDPLHEQVHLALMRLYGRGRRDLVRRQYERLSARLREELSSEPLPETTAEYHRLMTERG